ncbi:MAG: hypothetical protein K2X86_18015, partial [Cytophagaceae bacterium]|nr:hypothetical protein [Cytophagaceae bacterium]
MKKTTAFKSLILIPQLFIALSGLGQNFYIDPTEGNDNNSGQSPATAWRSLAKINATIFAPGSKILFEANGSWSGQLTPKGSGTAAA